MTYLKEELSLLEDNQRCTVTKIEKNKNVWFQNTIFTIECSRNPTKIFWFENVLIWKYFDLKMFWFLEDFRYNTVSNLFKKKISYPTCDNFSLCSHFFGQNSFITIYPLRASFSLKNGSWVNNCYLSCRSKLLVNIDTHSKR